MQKQSGNFLLQALLALTLVFAFMPFLVKNLAKRDMAAQMYSAKQSIEKVYNAARLFLYDNKDSLPIGKTTFEQGTLVGKLGPYGIPLGFNTTTALNQEISLVITIKNPSQAIATERDDDSGRVGTGMVDDQQFGTINDLQEKPEDVVNENTGPVIEAFVRVVPKDTSLSEYQIVELARMIGFFAKPYGKNIEIKVPIDVMYTDIVLRKEPGDGVGFLTELDMGGNRISNVRVLYAEGGKFVTGDFKEGDLYITGTNSAQKSDEVIELTGVSADRLSFYPVESEVGRQAAALSISGGPVKVQNCESSAEKNGAAYFGSVGDYSDRAIRSPDLVAEDADVKMFNSTNSFVSGRGVDWEVDSDFGYSPDYLEFGADFTPLITTTVNTTNLYGAKSGDFRHVSVGNEKGIKTHEIIGKIIVANSTMRDYDYYSPEKIVLDLDGTSKLPDINLTTGFEKTGKGCVMESPNVLLSGLNTSTDYVPSNGIVDCATVIGDLRKGGRTAIEDDDDTLVEQNLTFYHDYEHSLLMNIICNYVSWKRLEQKINMALCKMVQDTACRLDY